MSGPIGLRSRSLVYIIHRLADIQTSHVLTDIVAFVCVIVFTFKLKDDQGLARMPRLMRAVLKDGIHYFFVMAGFHVTMFFLTIVDKVIAILLLAERCTF